MYILWLYRKRYELVEIQYTWYLHNNISKQKLMYDDVKDQLIVLDYQDNADDQFKLSKVETVKKMKKIRQHREYTESNKTRLGQSRYLHHFISMKKLGIHLVEGFKGHRELSALLHNFLCSSDEETGTLELLSSISCKGSPHYGIEKFAIICDHQVQRNKKEDSVNLQNHGVFSYVEVRFINDNFVELVQLVRVLGICKLQLGNITHVVLIVLRMVTPADEVSAIPGLKRYSYSLKGNNQIKGLDIDIVFLKNVIRPACVIPRFTKDYTPHKVETFADNEKQKYIDWRFYQVPIHKMHYIDVLEYHNNQFENNVTEENEVNGNDYQDDSNLTMNSYQLFLSDYDMININNHASEHVGYDTEDENDNVEANFRRTDRHQINRTDNDAEGHN